MITPSRSPACVIASLALGSVLANVACGGSAPAAPAPAAAPVPALVATPTPTPTPPSPSPSTSTDAKTTPKLRLGHYSSADGTFGVVLDRLSRPPRVKVDGTNDVSSLAVRRPSSTETTFVTTRDDLVLTANDRGEVTAYLDTPAGGTREVRLIRDADAAPLGDLTAESPDAATSSASAALQASCGTSIDVQFTRTPTGTEAEGAVATAWRVARAFRRVCRDPLGKSAVAAKIHHLRVGPAKASTFELRGGTAFVSGDLEGEARGPFADEIQRFVESKL